MPRGRRAPVMLEPGSEWAVFRALQIANFTSARVYLDDAESIRDALRAVPESTPTVSPRCSTTARSSREYDRQLAETRSARDACACSGQDGLR